jgi:hypothetical protein
VKTRFQSLLSNGFNLCRYALGVDFQAYDSPDQAVVAAMKSSDGGVVSQEVVLEAPEVAL